MNKGHKEKTDEAIDNLLDKLKDKNVTAEDALRYSQSIESLRGLKHDSSAGS